MNTRFDVSAPADGAAVIDVVGEVDMESAPELQSLVEEALNDARSVAICFEHCTYLDSSVINVLVKMYKSALAKTLRFTVVAPPGSGPRRIFDVAGLQHMMPVVDRVADVSFT